MQEKDYALYLKAYIISLLLCPFGLFYAFKFFFYRKDYMEASICLLITFIILFLEIYFGPQLINHLFPGQPLTPDLRYVTPI